MAETQNDEIIRWVKRIDAKVDRIAHVLFEGNGDSMMTRLRVIEGKVEDHLKITDEQSDRSWDVRKVLFASLLTAIGSALVTLLLVYVTGGRP